MPSQITFDTLSFISNMIDNIFMCKQIILNTNATHPVNPIIL
jgi:hypothetical protein